MSFLLARAGTATLGQEVRAMWENKTEEPQFLTPCTTPPPKLPRPFTSGLSHEREMHFQIVSASAILSLSLNGSHVYILSIIAGDRKS